MDGAGAALGQRAHVGGGRVALVLGKAIAGVESVIQSAIMRSRSTLATMEAAAMERERASPSMMRLVRDAAVGQLQSVDKGEFGSGVERIEGACHGFAVGGGDAKLVDALGRQ